MSRRRASPGGEPKALERRRKLEKLLALLSRGKRLLVMTHDNPDPDSIAAAMALQKIARERAGIEAMIGYGGIVGRGENRSMLRSLRIELIRKSEIQFEAFDLYALVDTQPLTGNNSLPPELAPHIVIDHHPIRQPTRKAPYHDIRRHYGATTTLMAEYLFASRLKLDAAMATALFYGIKSETQSLGRESSAADKLVYMHLFPLIDPSSLWEIEHSPLSPVYFTMMVDAIRGTRVHGDAAFASLGSISVPDMVAEFADLIMRLDGIRWVFCVGLFQGDLYLSLRTSLRDGDAGEVIQRIVGAEGRAGGHDMIAGGKIPGAQFVQRGRQFEEELLRQRLLSILGIADVTGTALVDLEHQPPGMV